MYLPYLEIIDFYSVETHFSTPNVFSFLTFDLCISRAAHSPPSTNRIHILNLPTSVELCYHSEGMLPPYPVWFHWILGKVSEFCLWALSNNSLVDALCLPIWWGLYVSLFDPFQCANMEGEGPGECIKRIPAEKNGKLFEHYEPNALCVDKLHTPNSVTFLVTCDHVYKQR